MILAGLFPGISAAILTIPYPVLGGALVMLFASIVVTGFEWWLSVDLHLKIY